MREDAISLQSSDDSYEADLIERARQRDPDAWTAIYTRHHRQVYRYIRARVFDEAAAQDLSSTVFVEAIRSIRAYRYRGKPLLAWLYRIAKNVVGTHQRKVMRQSDGSRPLSLDLPRRIVRRISPRSSAGDSDEAQEPMAAGPQSDNPESILDRIELREALQELPETQRDVIVMRFVVGLTTEEIAKVMGKNPAAIYSLQARAVGTLRKRLRQQADG